MVASFWVVPISTYLMASQFKCVTKCRENEVSRYLQQVQLGPVEICMYRGSREVQRC